MRTGVWQVVAGLAFSILWASAATATKIGLQTTQPFIICVTRFFIAGFVMIFISHGLLRHRLPKGKEWIRIALYGLLSNTIYLSLFVLAMRHVSGGLGSLAVATNPVFINLLTTIFLRKRPKIAALFSLLLCTVGVTVAAWPLLQNSSSTTAGLLILLAGMLAYSVSAFYFSRVEWNGLPLLAINGWQVLTGGVFLLPLVALTWHPALNTWNTASVGSILWLAIPVSIGAVQLWLYLLKEDAARASFWLFLCPLFGFLISYIFTGERITGYTVIGMALVIAGIYWQQAGKPDRLPERK